MILAHASAVRKFTGVLLPPCILAPHVVNSVAHRNTSQHAFSQSPHWRDCRTDPFANQEPSFRLNFLSLASPTWLDLYYTSRLLYSDSIIWNSSIIFDYLRLELILSQEDQYKQTYFGYTIQNQIQLILITSFFNIRVVQDGCTSSI